MTSDLAAIAAAVDAALPSRTPDAWERAVTEHPTSLVRRPIYRPCGRVFGHLVHERAEVPTQGPRGSVRPSVERERPVTQALRCAFRQLATGTAADTVFVRVTRAFLAGDLPVPVHPERIVVEVDGTVGCDAVVQDGLLRLKALGCRVALGDFTGRADQRRLLPFADYVKVDARDLDLEGTPLLELATSRGAELVGEFVDTDETLLACRAAGFVAVQGRALQGPADAASAAVAASAVRLASAASR